MLETCLALLMFCAPQAPDADVPVDSMDLRVGHWVRVKGTTTPEGALAASAVEVREPADENQIIGTVVSVDTRSEDEIVLDVDGQPVFVGAKCRLRGLDTSDLAGLSGRRVGVDGYWRSPWKFSARELELRTKGRDRLEGRIDELRRVDGGWALSVMGRSVRIDESVTLEFERPADLIPLAEAVDFDDPVRSTRRTDDDDDLGGRQIGPNLWAGGQLEWRRSDEREFDLDKASLGDRIDDSLSVRGELRWAPTDWIYGLVEYRHAWRRRMEEDDGASAEDSAAITEAHVYLRDVFMKGLDLQLGRQDFDETREWLYDENLDAARAILRRSGVRMEWFYATAISDGTLFEESTDTVGGIVSTDTSEDWTLAAYGIHRENQLAGGHEAMHFGLRALGEFVDGQNSWGELAYLTGEDAGTDRSGWAMDVGTTWSPRRFDPWYFTAGIAFGSGDDDVSDGENGTFRQTGFQDNNAKFGGVTSFRYYGELLDPELANLRIATLGVGRRFGRRDSVDLVLHKYDQDVAVSSLVDAGIRRDPNGIDRDLGWEVDLVFGSRSNDNVSLEVVLGRFDPGRAFPGADPAWLAKFQVRVQL